MTKDIQFKKPSRSVSKKRSKRSKKNTVIGMITVPLSPGKKYFQVCGDSYISTAHVLWLQDAGLEVIPIPYTTDKHEWYFNQINGLYLPSGGAFAMTQLDYYNCCKKFLNLSIEANKKGDYFPIWGGCMGMQQMMIIADGNDNINNFLEKFDSFNNLNLPLLFTNEGINSRIMGISTAKNKTEKSYNEQFLLYLMSNDVTLNNHMLGLSPHKFKQSHNLNKSYKIVSYNFDRQGKKFISTIEHKKYPFYGVQWHPERARDMDFFSVFFAKEAQKNKHVSKFTKKDKLQRKKIHCMTYSNNLYKDCYFYWHNRTSAHNKRLCSVATLGGPKSNAI
tara:strand:+ start:3424 stop:4425 length:1002 start_codon:yes stop_codon:yes gene_type:complete